MGGDLMDYFKELMRISTTLKNENDTNIVQAAAVKLLKPPEPVKSKITHIPNWGVAIDELF